MLTASLSNLVIAETKVEQEGGPIHQYPAIPGLKQTGVQPAGQEAPAGMRIMASGCTGQLLLNPGFESGNVDWSTTADVITDDSADAYAGSWFAWLDGYTSAETDTLQQTVAIPAGCTATLTYELYVSTNERSSAGAIDTMALTVNGTAEQSFSNKTTTSGYVKETVNLSSFAGGNATLLWTSKQTGSRETSFFIDSTALTLSGGTSTATPSPTPSPTAIPTTKPTTSPTASPTTSPSASPTASPTSSPTSGCTGTAADSGPLTNSSGTLATGVAKPFDFPVQHGCNGAGYTAAIVIDDAVNTSYVKTYLTAAGVTQTGTITNEAVDGGGTADDPETDLDVQTISGLAPGANIIVYDDGFALRSKHRRRLQQGAQRWQGQRGELLVRRLRIERYVVRIGHQFDRRARRIRRRRILGVRRATPVPTSAETTTARVSAHRRAIRTSPRSAA